MTTTSARLLKLAEFDSDNAENQAAFWRLDNPDKSSAQSHYEGLRVENARLRFVAEIAAKALDLIEHIAEIEVDLGGGSVLLDDCNEVLADARKLIEEREGK